MRNPTTHDTRTEQETTDTPEHLELVLDPEHDTAMVWLEHHGEVNEAGEAILRQSRGGREQCEFCREERIVYTLAASVGGLPVCRDCFENHDAIEEVRDA